MQVVEHHLNGEEGRRFAEIVEQALEALKHQAVMTMYYNGHGQDPTKPAVNKNRYGLRCEFLWQEYLCPEAAEFLIEFKRTKATATE